MLLLTALLLTALLLLVVSMSASPFPFEVVSATGDSPYGIPIREELSDIILMCRLPLPPPSLPPPLAALPTPLPSIVEALPAVSKLEDCMVSALLPPPLVTLLRHDERDPLAALAAAASTAEVGDAPRRQSSEKRGLLVLLGSSDDMSDRVSSYLGNRVNATGGGGGVEGAGRGGRRDEGRTCLDATFQLKVDVEYFLHKSKKEHNMPRQGNAREG